MSIFGTSETVSKEFLNRVTNASFLSSPRKQISNLTDDMSSTTSDSSSSDSSYAEKGPLIKDLADHLMHSDRSVNTDKLPDNHPIHLENEARKFFGDHQPPFVLKKRPEVTKNVAIPTASGLRANEPTVVKAVARPWDNSLMFWTLDLNGLRYIVKPIPGAPVAGMKYLYWAGPHRDFDPKPLAFTHMDMVNLKDRYPKVFQSYTADMPADIEGKILPGRSRKHRRSASTSSSSENEDEAEVEGEGSNLLSKETSNKVDPRLQAPLQPIDNNAGPDRAFQQNWTKNALKKGKRPTRHSDLPRRVPFNTNGKAPTTSRKDTRKRRRTHLSTREITNLGDFPVPAPRRSTIDPSGSNLPAEQATARAGQHRSHQTKQLVVQAPLAESPTLSLQKQYRTALLVRVSPLLEYQPLKLSALPTLSAFFDQVLGVWEVAPENVAKVTVKFLWMDVADKMRTMVMNPSHEACWSHLLEQVDDAPCWDEEKGRCMLDVEIVGIE
jgi:hypothetical protein